MCCSSMETSQVLLTVRPAAVSVFCPCLASAYNLWSSIKQITDCTLHSMASSEKEAVGSKAAVIPCADKKHML